MERIAKYVQKNCRTVSLKEVSNSLLMKFSDKFKRQHCLMKVQWQDLWLGSVYVFPLTSTK